MQLEHQFTVPTPIDDAWKVLLDVPRIAPCMPGATLTEFDGDEFSGTVKVKLGPINLLYRGTGRFAETDEAARRIVIEASGKESRGSGTAAATVTATLVAEGDTTRVDVTTDLKITGRPAQFGRGMMADVGGKLLGQFADCLATTLGQSAQAAPAGSESAGQDAVGRNTSDAGADATAAGPARSDLSERGSVEQAEADQARVEPEPIDLFEITGAQAVIRRYAPLALAAAAVAAFVWFLARRRARHHP